MPWTLRVGEGVLPTRTAFVSSPFRTINSGNATELDCTIQPILNAIWGLPVRLPTRRVRGSEPLERPESPQRGWVLAWEQGSPLE